MERSAGKFSEAASTADAGRSTSAGAGSCGGGSCLENSKRHSFCRVCGKRRQAFQPT